MTDPANKPPFIDLAAGIVSAYVSNNHVQRAELTRLIGDVHQALASAAAGTAPEIAPEREKATPQAIRRSITADHLVSFEDGKPYKALRRHLTTRGLTPQLYREKWGLPADYPMAAPNYSKQRSELARALGLGQQRRKGLAKVSGKDALTVEAFQAEAESAAGELDQDEAVLAEVALPEAPRAGRKPKRAGAPRAKRAKAAPETA